MWRWDIYKRGTCLCISSWRIGLPLFGLAGHALFTGLFGMGLGLARQTMRRWLRYAAPVVDWLLGVVGHFLADGVGLIITLLLLIIGHPLATNAPTPDVSTLAEPFLQWL